MKREIKFRAWDNERNMFVAEGSICFNFYGDTYWEVNPNSLDYIGDKVHNGEPQRGRFDITQYTGVKDKNGKEIYEGDIFNVAYSHLGNLEVKWLDKGGWNICNYNLDHVEVIGNIYENPELIKTSKKHSKLKK